MNYFTYIVKCSDNSFVELVYYEIYDSKEIAVLREMQLKGWARIKKENLIKYGHPKKEKSKMEYGPLEK